MARMDRTPECSHAICSSKGFFVAVESVGNAMENDWNWSLRPASEADLDDMMSLLTSILQNVATNPSGGSSGPNTWFR